MYPPHFLPDPYPSPLEPKIKPHTNQQTNQPTKYLGDVELLQSASRRPSISLAISNVDRIIRF